MSSKKIVRKYFHVMILAGFIIILLSITLYSGNWPPISVVESSSMEHSQYFQFGTIETGSMVIVKKVSTISSITTYVQGRTTGMQTYGDYGDVLLYKNYEGSVIIHRAMFFLTWNLGMPDIHGYTNQSWITVSDNYVIIQDVGTSHRNLYVNISHFSGVSGFITMGDHNLIASTISDSIHLRNKTIIAYVAADQNILFQNNGSTYSPVNFTDVVGVARGDLPLVGLYRLYLLGAFGMWNGYDQVPIYSNYYLSLLTAFIISVPISLELMKRKEKVKKSKP